MIYKKLEEEFAKFHGSKYAVATNTGTAALHLALEAIGAGPGHEVIVPDFTMAACGFAVSYTGAEPIFVDCDKTFCIDPQLIEDKITSRTIAIMPVHIYGRICNMEAINEIAKKHGLWVIEDASEAHGAKLGNADITVYSFYKNKIVHAEEGGILCTNKKVIAETANDLKNMCFGASHNYFHNRVGFNYRMSDSQAEMALKSLKQIDKSLKRRREIEAIYDSYFKKGKLGKREVVWVYDLFSNNKDEIIKNVPEARHFFKPLSTMPMWRQPTGKYAQKIADTGFYLPCTAELTDKQVKDIAERVIIYL